jgi:hypothetical protein
MWLASQRVASPSRALRRRPFSVVSIRFRRLTASCGENVADNKRLSYGKDRFPWRSQPINVYLTKTM